MRVTHYRAAWNAITKVGQVELFDHDGFTQTLNGLDFGSFSAMVDLLRNEYPMEFDVASGWLTTSKERVGEEEGD